MQLQSFSDVTVHRVIHYKWEQWNEDTNKNEKKNFDLNIWFKRNLLNYGVAQEIQAAIKNEEDAGAAKIREFLLSAIDRWNLDDEITDETFNAIPSDLLTLIIETFNTLLSGENFTKPKN